MTSPIGAAAASFWLETCGDDLTPRPPLTGDEDVDVAILGGGYSGLWTAYYLLCAEPGLRVAVVEREVCGHGASGRNGGWCSPRFPLDPGALIRRHGLDGARATLTAMAEAVTEVGRVCADEGIDADYRRTGVLSVARGERQRPALLAAHATYERLQLPTTLLDADAAAERVRIEGLVAALHMPGAAMIHPARLVRGLARAVERRGGVIYEGTTVAALIGGATPALRTHRGVLRAKRAVVAAGEAELARQPGFHRALLPMSSLIVLTDPLTPAQWREIGWSGGEGLASQAHVVDYLTRTPDGRILYGSRGAPYRWGSRTDGAWDEATARAMRRELTDWFPVLRDIGFSHGWAGHLGVARDWAPTILFDAERRMGALFGYTGRGVATTNLAGRAIAGSILGRPTGLESLPVLGRRSRAWEPEPFRWLGVRYVQDAFHRIDAAQRAGRPAPFDAPLARWLSRQ